MSDEQYWKPGRGFLTFTLVCFGVAAVLQAISLVLYPRESQELLLGSLILLFCAGMAVDAALRLRRLSRNTTSRSVE